MDPRRCEDPRIHARSSFRCRRLYATNVAPALSRSASCTANATETQETHTAIMILPACASVRPTAVGIEVVPIPVVRTDGCPAGLAAGETILGARRCQRQ